MLFYIFIYFFIIHHYLIFLHTVMAVSAVANIVKSSLGPVGLDKMLVDDVGVSFHLPTYVYIYH